MGQRIFAAWGISTLALVTLFAFQNCAGNNGNIDFRAKMGTSGTADGVFGLGDPSDDPNNPTNIVCDPFATTEKTTPGLKGNLYIYEGPNASKEIKTLGDMFTKGKKIEDTTIYFSRIYVPTRAWETGFENQSGSKLENSKGETLIEWFGLKFETLIKLNDDDKEGYYQLATISDDGSVVEVDADGKGYKRVVDNDGETDTRMRCASSYIYLKKGDRLPARIAYFQGPRVEIALNLLWRRVDTKNPSMKHCSTNGGFFSGGKDAQKMIDLKARGWKVMETTNFELKEKVAVNCSK